MDTREFWKSNDRALPGTHTNTSVYGLAKDVRAPCGVSPVAARAGATAEARFRARFSVATARGGTEGPTVARTCVLLSVHLLPRWPPQRQRPLSNVPRTAAAGASSQPPVARGRMSCDAI